MKRAEVRELHEQGMEHLQGELHAKQEHLLRQIHMRIAAGEGVNPHEARETRRDIARIKTLIREKELGIDKKRQSSSTSQKADDQA